VNFTEKLGPDDRPGQCAILGEGGNKGSDDDEAGVVHQLRHFCDAADIFRAILGAEAQIAIKPMAYIIAIEYERQPSLIQQAPFQGKGQGRLSRGTQTRQPECDRLVPQQLLAVFWCHLTGMPCHE